MRKYQISLFGSIDAAPADDWESLRHGDADLATDRRLLRVFESTMTDQCRCWYAIVYDAGVPIASACFCRFEVDALDTAASTLQTAARWVRKLCPKLMKFGVLFCGLPLPAGATHLRIAADADVPAVMHCLHRAMESLARDTKSRLMVWKELDASMSHIASALKDLGYIGGDVPAAYTLRGEFRDGDDYLAALRSRYRRQIRESAIQGARHGATAEIYEGQNIAELFDDRLHAMYRNVRDKAEFRLETLPRAFFQSAARAFADDASLVVIRVDGDIVGYLFGLTGGDEYHNLYVGLDYARAKPPEVYFNLYTHDIDRALRSGVSRIHLGQTSDDFKARLGAVGRPLHFYARAVNPLLHAALRRFSRLAFPSVRTPQRHDVFRAVPTPTVQNKLHHSAVERPNLPRV